MTEHLRGCAISDAPALPRAWSGSAVGAGPDDLQGVLHVAEPLFRTDLVRSCGAARRGATVELDGQRPVVELADVERLVFQGGLDALRPTRARRHERAVLQGKRTGNGGRRGPPLWRRLTLATQVAAGSGNRPPSQRGSRGVRPFLSVDGCVKAHHRPKPTTILCVPLIRFILDGHRSVEHVEFDASPFTVLFGKNNAGKTNILETISGIFAPDNKQAIRRSHTDRGSSRRSPPSTRRSKPYRSTTGRSSPHEGVPHAGTWT